MSSREEIVKGVMGEFKVLSEEDKDRFVNDTLNAIIQAFENPKSLRKLLKTFFKRGRPSAEDLETINQLIVSFIYATKDEYQHQFGKIILNIFGKKYNIDVSKFVDEEEMTRRKTLRWVHLGLKPEIYAKLNQKMTEMQVNSLEEFFNHALEAIEKGERK